MTSPANPNVSPKHTGKHGHKGHGAKRFTFHPFEAALCGYSGAGKTTLAVKLLEKWSARYRVGYVKHDAHRFEMDTPGKDTYEATAAGAAAVMINDARHFAHISTLPYSRIDRGNALTNADFVIAEGFKQSDLPKLLLLDAEGRAESEFQAGTFKNVLAVVGPAARVDGFAGLPFFNRDDVDGIAAFLETHFMKLAAAPLYGLVLIGGKSRRMGQSKWSLNYTAETQAERTAKLLSGVCDQVSLSVRANQEQAGLPALPQIVDRFPPWGPLTGILSAMHAHPDAAWLVAAVDLPFLDAATLADLKAARDPFKIATGYRSANDGMPEPLCTIFEPRAAQRLMQAVAVGIDCPRKTLIESAPKLIDLRNPRALDNANTPEEYEAARSALREANS